MAFHDKLGDLDREESKLIDKDLDKNLTKEDIEYFNSANELTACIFEHYMKHHEIVIRKIKHARTATHQSLMECKNTGAPDKEREVQNIKRYDELWNSIVEILKEAGISENGLQKIEDILMGIPKIIKKYYDVLVAQDKPLLLLMKELTAEKYKRAFKIIHTAQAKQGHEQKQKETTSEEYILKKISAFSEENRIPQEVH
jgi:ABC-type uncharacterized transport system ATPase subunit